MNKFQPIIDWLTYRSYESNRLKSPHVPYYKWRKLYKEAIVFEEIFENNQDRIFKKLGESHDQCN